MSVEVELFLICIAIKDLSKNKRNPPFINALRNIINNAVQELLTNTSLLYKHMAVATDTEMLPQKYMYFEYNGHSTF